LQCRSVDLLPDTEDNDSSIETHTLSGLSGKGHYKRRKVVNDSKDAFDKDHAMEGGITTHHHEEALAFLQHRLSTCTPAKATLYSSQQMSMSSEVLAASKEAAATNNKENMLGPTNNAL
jgi:hypothetical protein